MRPSLLGLALGAALATPALAQRTPPPDVVEVTTQPAPVPGSTVTPTYPDVARRDSVGSRVILKMWIRSDGGVETADLQRVEVTRKDVPLPADNAYAPLFAAAALEAARQWRFTPAVKDGAPVDVWVTLPMRFRYSRD